MLAHDIWVLSLLALFVLVDENARVDPRVVPIIQDALGSAPSVALLTAREAAHSAKAHRSPQVSTWDAAEIHRVEMPRSHTRGSEEYGKPAVPDRLRARAAGPRRRGPAESEHAPRGAHAFTRVPRPREAAPDHPGTRSRLGMLVPAERAEVELAIERMLGMDGPSQRFAANRRRSAGSRGALFDRGVRTTKSRDRVFTTALRVVSSWVAEAAVRRRWSIYARTHLSRKHRGLNAR